MATLPSASLTIDDEAGAFGGGTGYICLLGPVPSNADLTPRVYGSSASIISQHGYSPLADYAAMHIEETGLPVMVVGMPVSTAGTVYSLDNSGVTGTSTVWAAASSSNSIFDAVDAVLTVTTGGTVGTNGIAFDLSLDGGRTNKRIRLGTATSYVIPYVGITISFGAGTLVAGDTFTFSSSAPMWSNTDLATARAALAAQQKLTRSWLVFGSISTSVQAGYITTEANAYETANDRFVYARCSLRDRRIAKMSKRVERIEDVSVTFAEVGATEDTATRASGSWLTDGLSPGYYVEFTGSVSNNVGGYAPSISSTVVTMDITDFADEGPVTVDVVASPHVRFTGTNEIIRSDDISWATDGFVQGATIVVSGTASNNGTFTIVSVDSSTQITVSGGTLVAEYAPSRTVSITSTESFASYVSSVDSAMATVDSQKRIDLGFGFARKASKIHGYSLRRSSAWAASIREYQHDLHIPCWRKSDGPLDGWDLYDDEGTLSEFDERVNSGALAARFTCFRSFANGPRGAFIALSMTRANESSLLSRTHNMAVTNLACTIAHAETENAIGQVLLLNSDGTAQETSLKAIESRVNAALNELVKSGPEGQRSSEATWQASRTDVLNVPAATLNGVLTLRLNGTIEQIATRVAVPTNG